MAGEGVSSKTSGFVQRTIPLTPGEAGLARPHTPSLPRLAGSPPSAGLKTPRAHPVSLHTQARPTLSSAASSTALAPPLPLALQAPSRTGRAWGLQGTSRGVWGGCRGSQGGGSEIPTPHLLGPRLRPHPEPGSGLGWEAQARPVFLGPGSRGPTALTSWGRCGADPFQAAKLPCGAEPGPRAQAVAPGTHPGGPAGAVAGADWPCPPGLAEFAHTGFHLGHQAVPQVQGEMLQRLARASWATAHPVEG